MKIYNKLSAENKIVYISLAVCSLVFLMILPLGQDLNFHLYRIGAMAEQLKMTGYAIPIRMLSASYNGYGYAVPLFYGDLMLYIPAFLVCLGISENIAFRLLLVSTFLLTFFVSKWAISRIADSQFSFYFALAYTFSSYFLIDLCIRMAIGEATAFIFMPMVAASIYGVIHKKNRYDWFVLSVGMTGMILCHNLTTILLTIILCCYVLAHILLTKGLIIKDIITPLFKAVGLFVGLSASYIFPFVEASAYQKYQLPMADDPDHIIYFAKHSLRLVEFLFPYEFNKIITSFVGMNYDLDIWGPGGIGIILLLLLILRIKVGTCSNKEIAIGTIISTVVYLILFFRPIMNLLAPLLSFMQFGWRIITFCAFFWSMYIAYALCNIAKNKYRIITILSIISIGLYVIGIRYAYQMYLNIQGQEYINETNPEYADNYKMAYNRNNGDNLYLPEGTNMDTYLERGEIVESDTDASYNFSREENELIVNIDNHLTSETIFECPLYMYKGYRAYDDDKHSLKIVKSDNNLVGVIVPTGYEGHIYISYKGTTIQRVSDIITLLTIAGVIVYILRIKKRTS